MHPQTKLFSYRSKGMNSERTEFLTWKVQPARLNATQTAWYLGFEPHQIAMLVGAGLLKPLGHPSRNSTKFFATETLGELRRDEKWLARATDAIANYWREQNTRKRNTNGHPSRFEALSQHPARPACAKPSPKEPEPRS